MQISQKLPQFQEKSLIVVSGTRLADIYFAFQGEINKIDTVEISSPKYSDKEGFFMRLGKGKFFGAGSVLEENKEEIDKKFIKELKNKIEDYFNRNGIEIIYLFASNNVKKELPEKLPNNIKEKTSFIAQGNYTKSHPFNLIKKIKNKKESKKTKFMSEAAMKILRKRK